MGEQQRDRRKYSRVYHEAVDDPKFRDVWDSDARLALWLRLLVAADAAWPASATLPRSTRRAALGSLVECGLVDLMNGDRYRIHGLDRERKGRSDAAAWAAQFRWSAAGNAPRNAPRNADGIAEAMPSREEKRKRLTEDVERINGQPPKVRFGPTGGVGKPR